MPAETQKLGAWEVWPEAGYNSRPFWTLARRNAAWQFGREYLLNPSRRDTKRFYAEAKAHAEAKRLNDATQTPQPASGVAGSEHQVKE